MDRYLRTKRHVSSIILTSFRHTGGGEGGVILPSPALKRTPKNPTQTRVKALTFNPDLILTEFENHL